MDHDGLSARIGRHAASVTYAGLGDGTRHATRRALLDAIGVMLAATGLADEAQPFARRAHAEGGRPAARLMGDGHRVPPATAAFANGALAHMLDFGDTFDAGPAHPNAALVPALLALADDDPGITLGSLVAAMAVGSDLACRCSLAPARPYEEGGWYPPPLCGTIGAAAGAAREIGLDGDGIVQAIGLAMCQATFPSEIKYDPDTRLRGLREAFAARAAVDAALLARDGVRAFAAPLEGRGGFFAIYGGGYRAEAMADLGAVFLGDAVSVKPWPSCRGTHAYIEAALALRPLIGDRTIVGIAARTGPVQAMLIEPLPAKARPTSAIDARFSIPFTVGLALATGEVTLDSFVSDRMADPAVIALAERVTALPDPSWGRAEAAAGALTVTLADGTRLHHDVPQAAGHPTRPMSDAALIDKFAMCAAHAAAPWADARARRVADRVLHAAPQLSASALLD